MNMDWSFCGTVQSNYGYVSFVRFIVQAPGSAPDLEIQVSLFVEVGSLRVGVLQSHRKFKGSVV